MGCRGPGQGPLGAADPCLGCAVSSTCIGQRGIPANWSSPRAVDYLLNVAYERVNVEWFREAVQRGLDTTLHAEAAAARTERDGALSWWRGPLFPEFGDTGERTRLAALRCGPRYGLAGVLPPLGQDDEAVAEAEAQLGDHSLHGARRGAGWDRAAAIGGFTRTAGNRPAVVTTRC